MERCVDCKHWTDQCNGSSNSGYHYGTCKEMMDKVECDIMSGYDGHIFIQFETEFDFGCVLFKALTTGKGK